MGSKCCAGCFRCCCSCCRCCCRRGWKDRSEEDEFPICIFPPICRSAKEVNQLASCRLADFERQKKIGHGRFGTVYKVIERHSQKELAMKEVQIFHEMYQMEPEMLEEYLVLAKLKSEWLMEILQCYETPSKLCLVLEYLPGPSLLHLAKQGPPLCPRLRVTYAAEMSLALQALHHHGFMHRDVKLSNFLLDRKGHVKLCDFGSCIRFLPRQLAKQMFPLNRGLQKPSDLHIFDLRRNFLNKHQHKPSIPHGTSYYCAPEVIRLATRRPPRRACYTFLCDYWSLGVCLYYLFFRHLPFYCDEKVRLPSLILNWQKSLKFPKKQRKRVGESGVSLIQGLLQAEDHRLGHNGLQDLACHPFFDQVNWHPIPALDLSAHGQGSAKPTPVQGSPCSSGQDSLVVQDSAGLVADRGSRLALPLSLRRYRKSVSSGATFSFSQRSSMTPQVSASATDISTPLLTKYPLLADGPAPLTDTNISAAASPQAPLPP